MIVTNVGGLADNVPHGKVGIVCQPDAKSISNAIEDFFKMDKHQLLLNLQSEKKLYSWDTFINKLINYDTTC
jgi:glycosyltransferase involved in cell wall biosynthesis